MSNYNMLVGRKKIEYIAHNIIISNHAKNRMEKRIRKAKSRNSRRNINKISSFW